ncbi:acyl carrier protein 4, chloroplastic-like [Momordica charantia]|uniref:Acyl carrier protein n=1 Tax=Momordica charantia TaxID=3673 RepID=A0A6J1BZC7_MOMCH|nr:acyl carrier protein 4, chloroplastic-like [Momordica charantia]WDW26408.1 chloroplast acyl carrier protein 4 [Momordica charantia]
MASFSASCLRFQLPLIPPTKININQVVRRISSVKFGWRKNGLHVLRTSQLRISCAAKPETVDKVCSVVRKQLALPAESELTPESKFLALGADSLDLVEIIMALEEEFDINIEEDNAQNITTVQEAADLIEDLVVNPNLNPTVE